MENPTILVADGDPKNLQILRDSLEASGFEVIVATDGLQAWQKVSSEVPDLILSEVNLPQLDGFQLLEKLKADPATSAIPLMFLTNRRELQDRVRSLRGGVKDYMIKPLHVKEVLARIRMILRRMERIKEEEIDSSRKLAGRLEEFSPVDLIESFGVERKTGVLTLHNENNRSGEIYFRDGAVVNAALGNLKTEKAVYQMLPWKRGHFTMIFKEINVPDEISVSNLGLLLQGFKRMEEREQLFKQLPSPETTFVMTETFRNIMQKRDASPEVAKFVSLIDGRRDILQVIDESTYDDIKTLERLVKLYQQGFIKPGKPGANVAEDKNDFSEGLAEPKLVQKILQAPPENKKTAKLLPEPRVVDLPPFRAEDPLALLPEAENGEARRHEAAQNATQPLPANDFADPFSKEALEHEDEPAALNFPHAKDDHLSEADALAAQELQNDAEEEDVIEIREVSSTPDPNFTLPSEFDRLLRSSGRGLSPDYIEPDLLPLDLGEIMKRPVAPPPFLTEHNGAGNGTKHFSSSPHTSEPEPESEPSLFNNFSSASTEPEEEPAPIVDLVAPTIAVPDPFESLSEPARAVPQSFEEPVAAEPSATTEEFEITPIYTLAKEEPAIVTPPKVAHAEPLVEEVLPEFASPQSEAPATSVSLAPAPAGGVADDVTAALLALAQHRKLARPRMIVIGRESKDISAFVKNTLGADASLRKRESATFQHFEIGERKLMGQPCEVIGISMEQQFTKLLAGAAKELSAYIMLVEAHRRQELSYLAYLLSVLKANYRLPFGLALVKSKDEKNLSKETIRDLLNLAETDYLHECHPDDLTEVAAFLSGLAHPENLARWA